MSDIFEGIYGQKHAKDALQKLCLSGRIPHALLFSGPAGVGKHFTAVRLAQFLNDTGHGQKGDSAIMKKIATLQEPYIKYIMPLPRGKNEGADNSPTEKLSSDTIELIQDEIQKKSENPYHIISIPDANIIKINSIRDIRKFISLNFNELKYRLIIISDAHLMNDEAQNTLLKSLEEPPEGIIFVLLTDNKNQLLETIRSRCWTVNFDPLSTEDIETVLSSNFKIPKDTARRVAPFSNGSVLMALKYAGHNLDDLQTRTINILRYSLALRYNSAMKEIAPVLEDSSGESLILLIGLINYWIADLYKNRYQAQDYFFQNHLDTIEKFNAKFSQVDMLRLSGRLDELASSVDRNVNLNVLALNIIFEIATLRYI